MRLGGQLVESEGGVEGAIDEGAHPSDPFVATPAGGLDRVQDRWPVDRGHTHRPTVTATAGERKGAGHLPGATPHDSLYSCR